MKKRRKIIIACISIVVSIAVYVGLSWGAVYVFSPPDKNRMEKYFERDKEDIFLVTEYFINSGHSFIEIDELDAKKGFMFVGYKKEIEDEAVVKAVNRLLKKRGYEKIGRYGNTIFFKKWSMAERKRGIAYSISVEYEPVLDYIINLELLPEDGWYYYEEDYNEWRIRYG